MDKHTIDVIEVFSSIQGEGAFVGCRQIFVRLAGCNLKCSYCDTKSSQKKSPSFAHLETTPGRQDFLKAQNALSVDYLANHINNLLKWPHHSVSLTGGEPILQAISAAKLASQINAPVYLETNGTLPEKLDIILEHVKYISMDIKLPSVSGTNKNYWREHEKFLKKAFSGSKNIFVKIVITEKTTSDEIKTATDIISGVSKNIPLIIQPVTLPDSLKPIAFETVMPFFEIALHKIADVRIIPQTHNIMEII
jgi:organic radical activating enzyme